MKNYYKISETIGLDSLDIPIFGDHTMSFNLKKYVRSKLPINELESYLPGIKRFEVHGIYPDMDMISSLDLDFEIVKVIALNNSKKDNSNSMRSIFFLAKRDSELFLACCVTPGRDLLLHYSSMIGYFLKKYPEVELSVFSYQRAEQNIDKWTGLDGKFIYQNDVVILGYSTFFKKAFNDDPLFFEISVEKNQYYTSTRFLAGSGIIVNCLEANYGHWGSISNYLSQKICELGAREIIHIGKAGTLNCSSEIYKRIYIPSKFLIARRSNVFHVPTSISNSLENRKEHLSAAHVSVSTTMEETLIQRDIFERLDIETIDIESSKIAYGVASYNIQKNKNVKFGAIYFSTDYLRKNHELNSLFKYDLSVKRTPLIKEKKNEILSQIFLVIKGHLNGYLKHGK